VGVLETLLVHREETRRPRVPQQTVARWHARTAQSPWRTLRAKKGFQLPQIRLKYTTILQYSMAVGGTAPQLLFALIAIRRGI
jgi:hypothetical protein